MEYGKCRGIERGMGRRDFLKAATLLGATAAGAGMLAGCAPKSASEAQAQTAPAATGGLDPADVDWKYETDVVREACLRSGEAVDWMMDTGRTYEGASPLPPVWSCGDTEADVVPR